MLYGQAVGLIRLQRSRERVIKELAKARETTPSTEQELVEEGRWDPGIQLKSAWDTGAYPKEVTDLDVRLFALQRKWAWHSRLGASMCAGKAQSRKACSMVQAEWKPWPRKGGAGKLPACLPALAAVQSSIALNSLPSKE